MIAEVVTPSIGVRAGLTAYIHRRSREKLILTSCDIAIQVFVPHTALAFVTNTNKESCRYTLDNTQKACSAQTSRSSRVTHTTHQSHTTPTTSPCPNKRVLLILFPSLVFSSSVQSRTVYHHSTSTSTQHEYITAPQHQLQIRCLRFSVNSKL